MTKYQMREYLAELETRIDAMLKKWKKESRIENGSAVQVEWQFEQSHIIVDLFWHDGKERIRLYCINPHVPLRTKEWKGLTKTTAVFLMDKIGNFAQIVMTMHAE